MVLCTFCKNITIEKIAVDYPPPLRRYDEPPGYSHQPDYLALLESAKTCELCRLISDVGETDGILPKFDPQFDEIPDQITRRNASQRLKLWAFRPGILGPHPNGLGLVGLNVSTAQRLSIYLEIVADEDSAAARSGDVVGRSINKDSGSAQTFDHIESWREICHNSHSRCKIILGSDAVPPQTMTQTNLPTRVLDIGTSESEKVRLFVSDGAKGQYAALSHRWGDKETMACTTTTNLNERTSEIPLDSLSQTFRDAISVTRRLGLSYLWIDSLCIVQDSHEDWERESATMGNVYGLSEITISAVASEDGTSGLLGPRDIYMVRADYRKSDADPGEGSIYFRRNKNGFRENVVDSALNKRAWVIQERTLAPRVLTFAKPQVFWECREMQAVEGGPQQDDVDNFSRKLMNDLLDLSLDQNSVPKKTAVYSAWRRLVEETSKAALTYDSDRLFTILGISKHIQRETRSGYLYGTLEEDLVLELLWSVWPSTTSGMFGKLPSVPRAPSWCWASIEGPIRFIFDDLKDCSVRFQRIILNVDQYQTYNPAITRSPSTALHLLALSRVVQVTMDAVSWGQSGPTLVMQDNEDWNFTAKGGGFAALNETGDIIGGARFDLQPNPNSFGEYSCLILLRWQTLQGKPAASCLLLRAKPRPTDAQETYLRIGTVSLSVTGIEWMRGAEKKLVTLV